MESFDYKRRTKPFGEFTVKYSGVDENYNQVFAIKNKSDDSPIQYLSREDAEYADVLLASKSIKKENAVNPAELTSIGFEITKDEISHGERYLQAREISSNGKRLLYLNLNYCGMTACTVKEDGGSRTIFNGQINSIEDIKWVLAHGI